jgi:hypothetical protein
MGSRALFPLENITLEIRNAKRLPFKKDEKSIS